MQTRGKNIAILILAAGAGTRMGKAKQLLPWGKTTLLGNAIEAASNLGSDVFVVLGAHAPQIKKEINQKVNFIQNDNWQLGMGTSIAKGVKHMAETKAYDAVIIMVADQPLLGSAYLQELTTAYFNGPEKIVATIYGKGHGVPALFDHTYFDKLSQLDQDVGAKFLMRKNLEDLKGLHPKESLTDIDTWATYTKLFNEHFPKNEAQNHDS
ncbi:MAG: nucleotidyltransferase family protein [Croceitalea sp.]|nr:nucleotidyltransferase family protein [Croceitalea sp.]